jgi:hypothetical protein
MVKADLSRDYYGDLELSPNADANDIKKQFKKLGMIALLRLVHLPLHPRSIADSLQQLCCTIQTVTQAVRPKSPRDSRKFSLRMRCSPTLMNAQSTTPIAFAPTTSIELEATSEATLGPMSLASSPPHPNLQLLVPVLRSLPRPLRALNDIRTLRRLVNLRINQLKREPKLGEAPMKHGRG